MVSDEEDIKQSLEILLSTRHGERIMQPEYGCNLDVLLFEPINTSLITFVKDLIEKAILYHEPRIDLTKIDINTGQVLEGLLLIELEYVIRSTNSRYNLVYPFYLKEAEQPPK
jgi:phage baseplate assembly protein W